MSEDQLGKVESAVRRPTSELCEKNDQNDSVGSDSDNIEDSHAGNVNKYYVLPNGYIGKPRKGMLIFNACFESGMKSFIF